MNAQDKHYQSALAAWRAGKETRAIVTPFAFKLAPELVGMPLARPWRRGVAILLDLTLVALLSSVPSIWIALLAGIGTWVLSKRHDQVVSAWARRWLRFVGSLVIFVVVLELVGTYLDDESDDSSDTEQTVSQLQQLSHTAAMVITAAKLDDCSNKVCVEEKLPFMKEQLDAVYPDKPGTRRELVTSLFDELAFLSAAEKQQYAAQLMAGVAPQAKDATVASEAPATEQTESDTSSGKIALTLQIVDDEPAQPDTPASETVTATPVATDSSKAAEPNTVIPVAADSSKVTEANTTTPNTVGAEDESLSDACVAALATEHDKMETSVQHSVIEWAKGIIADLGLGLSWGALYFTLFTALLRGQTPGKKLLGLRVVRLNGEPLTLWGAFGRYGGYGAGVTTGLLGFLQIYWDNNRQCIQDKIGETVVVMNAKLNQHIAEIAEAVKSETDEAPPTLTTPAST
ncbi:RDD family protein [Shewanella sp.]|uniref:RDD family protein n=1 Tax=Shewanella sp. TaxID=50422 RepID=UPI003A9749A5